MKNFTLFILFTLLSCTYLFSQQSININEGFEGTWPPAGWTATSFSQNGTVNSTPAGTRSASHSILLLGTASLVSPPFQVYSGEEFDTISFWLRHSAVTISGSISIDVVGDLTSDNIDSIDLSSVPINTWTRYSYSYNASQNDTVSVSLSVSHTISLGTMYIDDFRIHKSLILPVNMVLFTGRTNKNDVHLNWSTAGETNNSGFQLQRTSLKNNPGVWHDIAFVNGNGTSGEPHDYSYTDKGLNSGTYSYRIKQVDYNGNHEFYSLHEDMAIKSPDGFMLHQNYPNPSNPVTKIGYEIPHSGDVSLRVYDITGKEIAVIVNGFREAGYYQATFDGTGLASGVYFYRITAASYTQIRKMILVK